MRSVKLPSYSATVSTIALFVALGGTSYAVAELPRNSVGAKQLRVGAVNSAKVADGSLRRRDFKASDAPVGKQGEEGPPGPPGVAGAPGLASVEIVQNSGQTGPFGPIAACPEGKTVIGGGAIVQGVSGAVLTQSSPSGNGWRAGATASAGSVLTVYAVCAVVSG